MQRNSAKYLRAVAREISRFCRVREGTTAVEFALIAPAFLATLIALLQTCVFLFAQMALQNAAMEAGRYFLTGQAQNNGWTASTIASKVCPSAVFTCSNLIVIVQNYSSFAAANTSAPQLYSNGQPVTTWAYDPGTPGDVDRIFSRAQVIDSTTESFVFEITGSAEKLNAFIALMEPLGLAEVSRTGAVAIARGPGRF